MINNFITDKQNYNALHEKYICLPELGLLIDKETFKLVGSLHHDGYIVTSFNNKTIGVHRIIYCMFHGHLPKITDHINRKKADNRIENLREVTSSGNAINTSISKNNTSSVKGVTWNKYDNRWTAKIHYKNKLVFIGNFKYFINAIKARYYAEQKFNYDEYDIVSTAKKYLMYVEKFTFATNIKINPIKKGKKDLLKSEWEFFYMTKKQKIDKLAKN